MKLKHALTASVAGAALFALAAPVVTTNANADISNGNKNSLTVSGQIVRSILWADDGNNSDVFQTDGGTTSSRLRWVTKTQLNESTSIGGIIEMNIPQPNTMGSASLIDPGHGNATRISSGSSWATRKTDISITHKQFGTVSIGKGDPFSNGTTELGVGMGVMSGGVNNKPTAAGFSFATDNYTSTVTAGDVFSNFDGISRTVRVGYETPSFAGFTVGADWVDGSAGDAAIKYGGKFGAFSVDAAVSYANYSGINTATKDRYAGSIDIEHDSGLGVAFMYGHDNAKGTNVDDPKGYGAGVSYGTNLYSAGATKFALSYYETKNTVSNGDKGKAWQVGALQKFDSVGMDAGLMYTHLSYDDNTSNSYNNISTVLFSTRLQF